MEEKVPDALFELVCTTRLHSFTQVCHVGSENFMVMARIQIGEIMQ